LKTKFENKYDITLECPAGPNYPGPTPPDPNAEVVFIDLDKMSYPYPN